MQEIIQAIENRIRISFTYNNKKRSCEVYALGTSKTTDELVCRCYELPIAGFKLFFVDKMKNVSLENRRWYIPRSGYNWNGDTSMDEVLFKI